MRGLGGIFLGVLVLLLGVGSSLVSSPAQSQDLAEGQLLVAGTRLVVSPESQTVPFDTATVIDTRLEGYDTSLGVLPEHLRVVGDFTGPGVQGILELETRPGQPFRIPRLSRKGEYQLDNIRLVQEGELLAYAEPRSAAVLVTQVLVARVTSRPMTLDEIRSYGIVVDGDNFRAFNFTFGFGVGGDTFDYNIPLIFEPGEAGSRDRVHFLREKVTLGRSLGTTAPRFRPPQMAPFQLELDLPEREEPPAMPGGGCQAVLGDCRTSAFVPVPGVILFPTDVAMLNQFFSVMLVARNDAPAGDPLTLRDLTAKVVLPPGLRQAETEPPTPLGVPIPVRVPGPDGRLGTGDDLTFLMAQGEGRAEVVVEGRQEGTHVVEFQLEGVLEGLPDGKLRRVVGSAQGAVLVRDPTFGVTITHPEIVRTDEEFSLLLTVSNTSSVAANLLTVSLPVSGLSGVSVVGASSRTIESLPPGESEVVEFRLSSQRTGRVVATSARVGTQVAPRFDLVVGVGENDIPLSPTAIILPRESDALPPELNRRALALMGLAFSLATTPAETLSPSLPQLDMDEVDEKVYWYGQTGRHVSMGEDLFDSLAVLSAEWSGARDAHWEWDFLRRSTEKGMAIAESFGEVFAAEATATSPRDALDRYAATTAFLGPIQGALAVGGGTDLDVSSQATGLAVAGAGTDPQRIRELPFAARYELGNAPLAILAVPEETGYEARLTDTDGGLSALHLLVPDSQGGLRRVDWTGVSLGANGVATVAFAAADTSFTLRVDSDGDGLLDGQIPGTVVPLTPRSFTALGAVQNPLDPSGHIIEVLFTRDVDLGSLLPRDPERFTIPDKVSNGGLIPVEEDIANVFQGVIFENPFAGLRNSRVVRVVFDNPISPYLSQELTVRDVASIDGASVVGAVLPVLTTVTDPGGLVQGTVYGPDGQPVPFARVDLLERDFFFGPNSGCSRHRTASVQADAQGGFLFDYVRQTTCADTFIVAAQDPVSGHFGTAHGRLRFVGQTHELDVLMLGRGTIRGRLTYEDGTVPAEPRLVAYSPVFFEGREASFGDSGFFEVTDVPVGTVTVAAGDGEGSFVFQTLEIPTAGAVVERDLVIIRRPPNEATGDVRGTILSTDGVTPEADAYLALYVDGELVGVERSRLDGSFDFGTVPVGVGEIEAFDGQTGLAGTQVFFDILPDQVNDLTLLLRDDRGAIEGRVLRQSDSGTTPVAGAVVWVSGTPFNTITDDQGMYRLESVFAGDRTLLAADLERNVQVSEVVTVNGDGSTVFRDLIFFEESSVSSGLAGEVLGFNGAPVSGAAVHLSVGSSNQWFGEAFTDTSGRFFMPNLAPGTYEVHAVAGGGGGRAQATIRFQGETPFVRIQFARGTIRGVAKTLTEAGTEVGVKSLVTYRKTVVFEGLVLLDPTEEILETEDDGSFEIPALLGPYVLTVHNAFHGEKTIRGELLFADQVNDHEIVFERNGSISGRVLDWDGLTPVAGATVHLRHPNFSEFDLTTDAEGRFHFDLVPPEVRRFPIEAEIDTGLVYRTTRAWVRFNRAGQDLELDLVLPIQGTVSGFVEDSTGAAVPGAVVQVREQGFPGRTFDQNADGDGFFVVPNVMEGGVTVQAQAPALGGLGGQASTTIDAEGEEEFVLVTLQATASITGVVIDPTTGEPAPSVQVALREPTLGRLVDAVTASPAGTFEFSLLPLDDYLVEVFDPRTGRNGLVSGLILDANGQELAVEVILEVRGDVDGHLREPDTLQAVPGATVRLRSRSLSDFTTYSSTDVEGYFEFLGIPEGEFELWVREPEGRREATGEGAITMEGQLVTVDLVLQVTGRITGSVLNPPGQPAGLFPNANVVLVQGGKVIGATLQNPFTFEGVIPDQRFELRVSEVGGDHEGFVKATLPDGQAEITVDVPIRPIGDVTVTVTDSFGNPVGGADLSLLNRGFYTRNFYGNLQAFAASSGPDGRAVIAGVGEGSVNVTATDPLTGLRGSAASSITLDGVTVDVPVQLQDTADVTGRVLLSDGLTPAAEALVVLTLNSTTYQTFADDLGDFTLTSLPLGSARLNVQERFGPGEIERFATLDTNGQTWDFGTLVLDDIPPEVVALDPVTASRDLPLSTTVTIQFSEPLDTGRYASNWFTFRNLAGFTVNHTVAWPDAQTAVLTPAALANFTGYEVVVNDAIDLAGRHLGQVVRTVFHTVDQVPPAVLSLDPAEGTNQVPLTANLTVTFSEPVDFASLSGPALQLTDLTTGQGVTTTFVLLAGERTVRITPATGLVENHQYRLTVQGVQDGSGNAMTAPVSTSFWSIDTLPPTITDVTLPNGTTYTAGDPVTVQVTATDDWGVASAKAILGPAEHLDSNEPFELVVTAPFLGAAGNADLTVEVADVYGNTATSTVSLQVNPRVNAAAPLVTLNCLREGDGVDPGHSLEVQPRITDDEAVESVVLRVDGIEQQRIDFIDDPEIRPVFQWMPPAGSPVGTSWLVAVEARDYAGNVSSQAVTLVARNASVLTGGGTLSGVDGTDLVLGEGTFFTVADLSPNTLEILRGGRLVVRGDVVSTVGDLAVDCGGRVEGFQETSTELLVGGTARVDGAVDVTGSGWPGATLDTDYGQAPQGILGATEPVGASHGGTGSEGVQASTPTPVSEVFGSVYRPRDWGGGGSKAQYAAATDGGAGGGALRLTAGVVDVNGSILARGATATLSSTGAGGSIFIESPVLRGSGRIDAGGGEPRDTVFMANGTGGGGRIALRVDTLDGFDLSQASAFGGRWIDPDDGLPKNWAAPGTVLWESSTHVSGGELTVRAGTEEDGVTIRGGGPTALPVLGTGAVVGWSVSGSDAWVTTDRVLDSRWDGAWMVLVDGSGADLGSFRVAQLDTQGAALLAGAGTVTGAVAFRGEYRFDRLTLTEGGRLLFADEIHAEDLWIDGEVRLPARVSATDMTIVQGSRVEPVAGVSRLLFEVSGTLRVEPGAVIDVSGLGYAGGDISARDGTAPAGLAVSQPNAGASHGGSGSPGNNLGVPGEVYGSIFAPRERGAGASYSSSGGFGGRGGGAVELVVGTLDLDGRILALGEERVVNNGGAGGSVWVTAGTITGTGSIDVRGGDGLDHGSVGGGGGGRAALHVGTFDGFDPQAQVIAWGGRRVDAGISQEWAAPGTVLVKTALDTYGALLVDVGFEDDGVTPRQGMRTELPTLGSPVVSAWEVAGADAWVTAATPQRERWVGSWARVLDGAGADLGAFEVAEVDATGRLRLAEAAAVAGAASLVGEYRFDRVTLLRGAGLDATDPWSVTDLRIAGDSRVSSPVTAENLTVSSGAVLRPAIGSHLRLEIPGTLTVASGGRVDVSELGWPGGDFDARVGKVPPGVQAGTDAAGGSHGGAGTGLKSWEEAGEIFGSVYRPRQSGGGGGYLNNSGATDGGAGGGFLEVVAGTVVLDGELSARGGDAQTSAAGAGGSVQVQAAQLSGTGVIDAGGGSAQQTSAGNGGNAGGGGRVALRVDQLTLFDPETQVITAGGSVLFSGSPIHHAATGTVFVSTATHTWGDLYVRQPSTGLPVETTVLTSIGKGTVGLVEVDSGDPNALWIEPSDPAKLFDVGVTGMWVRVGGVDYPVIGESADRRRLLLDGAAGVVQVGDAFVGLYKFDAVHVLADAQLSIRDGDEVGQFVVDPSASLERLDLQGPDIVVTAPAAGTSYASGQTVNVTADVTDPSGVAQVTFQLGTQSFTDTAAPWTWSSPAPVMEVAGDVLIHVEATDLGGNVSALNHPIHVLAVNDALPPVVSIPCPSSGLRLAPGTGIDLFVDASHEDGIERVELLLGDDPTVLATDLAAPWQLRFDAPLSAVEGDVLNVKVRARSWVGSTAEVVLPVPVVEGAVLTADTFLAATDLSLDGGSVVVAGGTLAVEGTHTFRDLIVLDGAVVTHPASTRSQVERLDVSLTRDLVVACGGVIDVTGRGYPGGLSLPRSGTLPTVWVDDDFEDLDLVGWTVSDVGETHAPSNWVPRSEGYLDQQSNIHESSGTRGTVAYWAAGVPSPDYRFTARVRGWDDDSIGLVFRYQDDDNFYRFDWNYQSRFRRIDKYVGGVRTTLAEDAVRYDWRGWHEVDVIVVGTHMEVWVDGVLVLEADDADLASGTVGLTSWACQGAHFDDVLVMEAGTVPFLAGGSHGGRGGAFDGFGRVYGSLFDPVEAGAGGGSVLGSAGGGIVGVTATGDMIVDGAILAQGESSDTARTLGAGGAVRLDAADIRGQGWIDVAGGSGSTALGAGGGGRVALYGAAVDSAFAERTALAGGDAANSGRRGAPGTLFVRRDAQPAGELFIDNADRVTDHITTLPAAGEGTVDGVTADSITDSTAAFPHDLRGSEVGFNGNFTSLWPVVSHPDGGQTLTLDITGQPLTAQMGATYQGVYRFDRVVVRRGASVLTASPVFGATPEVDATSSWLADHQPSLVLTEPVDGASVIAGNTVTLRATVDDAFGVPEVLFQLGAQQAVDTTLPYEASFIVPPTAAASTQDASATVVDLDGRLLEQVNTLSWLPTPDSQPPVLSVTSGLVEGEYVLPDEAVSYVFQGVDDGLVWSWRILVDGVVQSEQSAVQTASVSPTLDWTVPAAALPGQVFTVRFEVEDFGANLAVLERTVQIPTGTLLSGGQALDTTLDGQDLVLAGGTFTVVPPFQPGSLTVLKDAVVVPASGGRLEFTVLGTLEIRPGGLLDVTGLGYAGGTSADPIGGVPSWVSGPSPDGGGGHGGVGIGWHVVGPSGETYDSVYMPDLVGGGGSEDDDASGDGFPGGGVVVIDAGSVVLDGEIRARGTDYNRESLGHAAGGGGTVRIRAGGLVGQGLVDASGGFSNACVGSRAVGAGGGGRVALEVDDLTGFDVASQVRTWGGALWWCSNGFARYAPPGTVFVSTLSSTHGDLRIDPGREADGSERTLESTFTTLPTLGAGLVSAVEVSGVDLWVTGDVQFRQRWLGAWMVLEDGVGTDVGTFEVVALDGAGRALLAGADTVTGAAAFRGEYRFDRVDLANGAGLASSDVVRVAGEVLAQGTGAQLPASTLVAQDLSIPAGSIVTVTQGNRLELSVLGTLTVEAGAVLDVTGLGYAGGSSASPDGGAPVGVNGSQLGAGGTHGGYGSHRVPPTSSGEVYDSVYFPELPGGGGSLDDDGSGDGLAGGGVLVVNAGTVVLDGDLRARGTDNDDQGRAGGAGGTVVVRAASLTGLGTVDVAGGYSRSCHSSRNVGPGGGGRVALEVDSLAGFDVPTQVLHRGGVVYGCSWGEAGFAGAGTVFHLSATSTHGDLTVIRTSGDAPSTALPTAGTGTVGVTDPDAATSADLWIEPQDPAVLFDLGVSGMWLRIGGNDYRILDQTPDRRRVLLEGATGIVSVGETYQGVYKFDTVIVRGGTVLEFVDSTEITTVDADADSQVVTP